MAALEASLSLTATSSLYSSSSSSSSPAKLVSFNTARHPNSIKLIATASPILLPHGHSLRSLLRSPSPVAGKTRLCFSVQEVAAAQEEEVPESPEDSDTQIKKKLYVANLPWSLTVVDIKNLFVPCGTVVDVEIIKQKDGKSRGFAFVTMETGEQAQAVIDKFHLQEVLGRVVKVEFSKRFKKPPPPSPPGPKPKETRHKLYVTNLEWKARSTHLRELVVAENFNPLSARVVFDSPKGRSNGYGFISFATKEEADLALSTLNGKELLGRPLRVKLSEKKPNTVAEKPKEEEEAAVTEKPKEEEEATGEDQAQES